MSLLDRKSCSIQETWSSAKSDTTNSCCRRPRMDSNRHHPLQQEIQCYLESKNPPLYNLFLLFFIANALQNSTISDGLWLPTIDKEYQFSKPLPKSKAITASSVDEKIINYQNQLDGCCWRVIPFYSMGYRLFSQGTHTLPWFHNEILFQITSLPLPISTGRTKSPASSTPVESENGAEEQSISRAKASFVGMMMKRNSSADRSLIFSSTSLI